MATSSPFPGMDPWLEESWGGLHTSLATYARDQLQAQIGNGLVARLQERVYVETEFVEPYQYVPDVHVYARSKTPVRRGKSSAAVAEPVRLPLQTWEVLEPYVEIIDLKSSGRLVTAIELVSPVNKRGVKGRALYTKKQRDVVRSRSNLVEIDLLRSGRAVTLARTKSMPVKPTPYHISIWRPTAHESVEYYPIELRTALPKLAIPLRKNEADAVLDLQSLFDLAYANARYDEVIDYAIPPVPPLESADFTWAKKQIAAWRKRTA